MAFSDKRVLSIQSHVVSGYVGNKSATFPMQVHGYDVDSINSVQLCNHTGYKVFQGQVMKAEEVRTLYEGLKQNEIDRYSHVLTGYVGSESFLLEVVNIIKEMKERNPKTLFVCDPVMGDFGVGYYVPKELMPIYRDQLIPLSDIVTPNQFEAELLAGMTIKTEQDALKCMDVIHGLGVKNVVISSTELAERDDTLLLLGSQLIGDKKKIIKLEMKKFEAHYTGTGDLFTALLLVWSHRHPENLALACEKTISTMQIMLKRTLDAAREIAGPGNAPNVAQLELRMVQSKKDIEEPPTGLVKATVTEK